MDNGTPNGETATPKAPENGTPTPQTPPAGNGSEGAGEAEKLRKELEQARMRENQLLNEKKERDAKDEAERNRKLEEDNQFKELYEQEKTKRETIESERKAEINRKEIDAARTEVMSDFSDDVKELAEEAGLSLDSAEDDAKAAYKAKLEKIQAKLGTTSKVTPNNPGKPSGQPQLSQAELRAALKDPVEFAKIAANKPGIALMMNKRQ